jgi:two-component system OmpR family response regulator
MEKHMKVLLVDDDVELALMLKAYLRQEGFDVAVVQDGKKGVTEALSGKYMIVVLDVMMPRLNGLETLISIRIASQIPVLMLTAKGDDTDRITGLELGADDYVPKPCTPRELTARIRAILRRTQYFTPEPTLDPPLVVGLLTMWPERRQAEWGGQPIALTSTEFSLLEVLVRNAGRPVSKNKLSEQVLGRPLSPYDRNIEVHLSSLRRRLGLLEDGRSCIQTVYRLGYQFIKE